MLIGLSVLIGIALVVLVLGSHGILAKRSAATSEARRSFEPRGRMDSSGFTSVVENLPRWRPDSTLDELSAIWKDVGRANIAEIDGTLANPAVSASDRYMLLLTKAMFLNYEGDPRAAYDLLTQTRTWLESDPVLAAQGLYTLIYLQGVTALSAAKPITA